MLRRGVARAAAVVVLANAIFLGSLLVAPGPPDAVAARVRGAFHSGDLDSADYVRKSIRRGWHQYNDCGILQMLSNPGQPRIARALAPLKYHGDSTFSVGCPTLGVLVLREPIGTRCLPSATPATGTDTWYRRRLRFA